MSFGHRPRLRRWSAWIAIWAVWVQALLPAVHHPASLALGPLALATGHELCLAPGSQPTGPHDHAPAQKMPVCPLCQAAHAIGSFTPPTAQSLSPPRSFSLVFATHESFSHPRRWPRETGQARAPPVKI